MSASHRLAHSRHHLWKPFRFPETNVTWSLIPEGVQAVRRAVRKRMVLISVDRSGFTRTTAVHGARHIFSYDIMYRHAPQIGVLAQHALSDSSMVRWRDSPSTTRRGTIEAARCSCADATRFRLSDRSRLHRRIHGVQVGTAAIFYLNETYGPGQGHRDHG